MDEFLNINYIIINILLKIPSTVFEKLNPKYKLNFKLNNNLDNNIIIYRNKIITKYYFILINCNFDIKVNETFIQYFINKLDKYEVNINNIIYNNKLVIGYDINVNVENTIYDNNLIFEDWINLHN